MKCIGLLLFITIFGGTWRLGRPTCVLESDFGFTLNCAFKKSSLFRVRNLGGVKAHIGLGISVGDELGFKESLSNVEANRRRSVETSKLQAQLIQAQQKTKEASNAVRVRSPAPEAAAAASAAVPPFRPIPPAAERPEVVPRPAAAGVMPQRVMAVMVPSKPEKLSSTNFALRTLPAPAPAEVASNSIQALLAANNVTEEMLLQAALAQRRPPAPTTTTTTFRPTVSRFASSVGKVMNAPKEYYPVGYDKNFDDNFASRVELPETSFYCGDQKHFPGLYADEDLGCMVFHVCALTDDGLIGKSFLCPESTLFDQTILKCNWWFYVDCKSSKKLYDSNIPISKSYQLMKALTFFSGYKKDTTSTPKTKEKD